MQQITQYLLFTFICTALFARSIYAAWAKGIIPKPRVQAPDFTRLNQNTRQRVPVSKH